MKTFRLLNDWITPWCTVKAGTISRPYQTFKDDDNPHQVNTHVEFLATNGKFMEEYIENCLRKPDWFEEIEPEKELHDRVNRLELVVLEYQKRLTYLESHFRPGPK
jgi:hypothetical protein